METEWERLYLMQVKKPTKTDDGVREVFINRATGEFKYRRQVGTYQVDKRTNSPVMTIFEDEEN